MRFSLRTASSNSSKALNLLSALIAISTSSNSTRITRRICSAASPASYPSLSPGPKGPRNIARSTVNISTICYRVCRHNQMLAPVQTCPSTQLYRFGTKPIQAFAGPCTRASCKGFGDKLSAVEQLCTALDRVLRSAWCQYVLNGHADLSA